MLVVFNDAGCRLVRLGRRARPVASLSGQSVAGSLFTSYKKVSDQRYCDLDGGETKKVPGIRYQEWGSKRKKGRACWET